jgi:hypothetical protein
VVSLNVPAMGEYGQEHPLYSFEIEFDPEQPDRLVICLLELDQDAFVRVVRKSVPFSAWLAADLVTQRKATEEEVADWQAGEDEDDEVRAA